MDKLVLLCWVLILGLKLKPLVLHQSVIFHYLIYGIDNPKGNQLQTQSENIPSCNVNR
jgi:hypothetical protein